MLRQSHAGWRSASIVISLHIIIRIAATLSDFINNSQTQKGLKIKQLSLGKIFISVLLLPENIYESQYGKAV